MNLTSYIAWPIICHPDNLRETTYRKCAMFTPVSLLFNAGVNYSVPCNVLGRTPSVATRHETWTPPSPESCCHRHGPHACPPCASCRACMSASNVPIITKKPQDDHKWALASTDTLISFFAGSNRQLKQQAQHFLRFLHISFDCFKKHQFHNPLRVWVGTCFD